METWTWNSSSWEFSLSTHRTAISRSAQVRNAAKLRSGARASRRWWRCGGWRPPEPELSKNSHVQRLIRFKIFINSRRYATECNCCLRCTYSSSDHSANFRGVYEVSMSQHSSGSRFSNPSTLQRAKQTLWRFLQSGNSIPAILEIGEIHP